MPQTVQISLDSIRKKLIEARAHHIGGRLDESRSKSREVKQLVGKLSSLGDFRKSIDSMFAAHVPEAEIQQFIARA